MFLKYKYNAEEMLTCGEDLLKSYPATLFCVFPSRKAFMLSSTIPMSLCLVSSPAHAMWGVIMQFFALYRGQSSRGVFVHYRSSGGVYKICAVLHHSDSIGIYKVFRVLVKWAVEGNYVALVQKLLEGNKLHAVKFLF